ncbi:MAG: efflux RND transporter permease subunit [Xanthomonadales bacterium]|nr:efflux RND transporter permease subunit [Xanthomonadales bacterium]
MAERPSTEGGFHRLLRHGTLIAVAVLILCVLGLVAALRVPVQMIPDLEVRTISIDTGWPGATPQDVEQEILLEQEQYLRTLPNLRRMVSSASTGRARITLEFPFGVDINEALIRTNNALSQVRAYPENVDQPRLSTSSFSANAFMFFRIAALPGGPGEDLDLDMLGDYLEDEVRPRLERVPGVALIDISGTSQRQVRIEVDPQRLAQRGLGLAQVRQALRSRNRDVSAGDLDSGKRSYLLRTVGRFADVAELGDLILAERAGSVLRLRDVAEIRLDHFELRDLSFYNGRPSLGLSVRREPGSNVIQIKRDLLPEVEQVNVDLLRPMGLELSLSSDDVRYVEQSVANVWTNLALGALLATLVMYAFLRSGRATLIGVIAIPICTVAAFVGLLAAGRTLNVISLAGVAFAIGMTLDNTIVVLESIDQARRRGLDRMAAAVAGVQRVWPAVLASTLTTVLVFAPILFVEEEAGQIFSDIAIAISASILASMLVAISVVPALGARLDADQLGGQPAGSALFERIAQAIDGLVASRTRRVAAMSGLAALALLALFVLTPPAEYLPEGEEPKTFSRMIAPPGYNLAEMQRIGMEMIEEVNPALTLAPEQYRGEPGELPPLAYYNLGINPGGLRIIGEPQDPAHIEAMMDALDQRFRSYPGMRAFSARGSIISSNDGGSRSINLDISGAVELGTLYRVAEQAFRRAEALFEGARVGSDPSTLSLDQPLVQVRPRWERLAEAGLNAADFGYAVAALSDGAFVDEMILGDDKVDVYLFSQAGHAQQLEQLADLPVATPSGAVLPLSALADLRETVDSGSIRRLDGRRTVTLSIVPPRSVALESGVAVVREQLVEAMRRAGEIPNGVSIKLSGASDQLSATRASMAGNFVIAVLLSYLLLVAIFRHWGRPWLVMLTVPLGIAGGVIGLALLNAFGAAMGWLGLGGFNQPFDMITLLGFLVLLGTVVNNPILIVDEAYQRLQEGAADAGQAVSEAVRTRLRPILMSTLTTLFGLAPLVLIPGAGTELYRGLGAIVLGGLAFSTLITLTFLPALLVQALQLSAGRGGKVAQR